MKPNSHSIFCFFCIGLDPSGYRSAARHNDEADAFLGGQTQMTDEERFKVLEKALSYFFKTFVCVLTVLILLDNPQSRLHPPQLLHEKST